MKRPPGEKMLQRARLLCRLPEYRDKAKEALLEAGRPDLIGELV